MWGGWKNGPAEYTLSATHIAIGIALLYLSPEWVTQN